MKIGSFLKDKENKFSGNIWTLGLGDFEIILEPNQSTSENAPTHRAYVDTGDTDRYEIGAAWEKISKKENAYIQMVLDCPSFPKPAYFNLFEETMNVYVVNWERQKPKSE